MKRYITNLYNRLSNHPLLGPLVRHRFMKFGTVGFSGTIINIVMLYLNQEYLFRNIQPAEKRLHLSLSGAIFVATISNFFLNRAWTWGDRKGLARYRMFVQLWQYFVASGFAIGIQYILTILFSQLVHYLLANVLSIIIAAVFTYIVNDIWTFAVKRR